MDTFAKSALVTNSTGFAGPAAVASLLEGGFQVFAHDVGFKDEEVWHSFAQGRANLQPIVHQAPFDIVASVLERTPSLNAVISNDHFPAANISP